MRRLIFFLLTVVSLMASSALAFTAADGSCALAWDESPQPTIALQYYFYTRREGESYRWAIRAPGGGLPAASAEHREGSIEQRLPCERVVLAGDGRYYLVVTAVTLDLSEETGPSNEIWLDVRGGVVVAKGVVEQEPPPMPVEPKPPQIPVVPKPPGVKVGDLPKPPAFVVIPPTTPPQTTGSRALVDSCIWNSCQPSTIPRTLPPGFGQGSPSLGESQIWNGKR